jgi:hypothetical protein
LGDLLRLVAIARRASAPIPFAVDVTNDNGSVRIKTVAAKAACRSSLDGGTITSVVWDHAPEPADVVLRVAPGIRVGITVANHRFEHLESAARTNPRLAREALERALGT